MSLDDGWAKFDAFVGAHWGDEADVAQVTCEIDTRPCIVDQLGSCPSCGLPDARVRCGPCRKPCFCGHTSQRAAWALQPLDDRKQAGYCPAAASDHQADVRGGTNRVRLAIAKAAATAPETKGLLAASAAAVMAPTLEQRRALEVALGQCLEQLLKLRAAGPTRREEADALKIAFEGIARELQYQRNIVADWLLQAFCQVAPLILRFLNLSDALRLGRLSRGLRQACEVPDFSSADLGTSEPPRNRLNIAHLQGTLGSINLQEAARLVDALSLASLRSLQADLPLSTFGAVDSGWAALFSRLAGTSDEGDGISGLSLCTGLERLRLTVIDDEVETHASTVANEKNITLPTGLLRGIGDLEALMHLEVVGMPTSLLRVDLQVLAESLASLENLQTLSLVDIVSEDACQDASCFFWSLGFFVQHADALHTVRIAGWQESSCCELLEFFKRAFGAPSLRTLDLSRCGLQDASVQALCKSLASSKCCSLNTLLLKQVSCSLAAEEMLQQMLEVNSTLEHVTFW